MHSTTKLIVRSALFLALAVILPIAFHQFGLAGRMFNPMHIPVLLAGFICGPVGGVIVGLLSPAISFMITGMPPSYAVPLMSLELPIYGLIAGLTYVRLKLNIYVALILAIIFGRLAFALGLLILGFFIELPYGLETYFKVVLATGLPGTLVQLVIIPPITAALMRRRKL
ncbi:MAG: ECF transporter S component [FCB group bacterium]|nr:ECF transporter S component [FCB group bacterium]